MVLQKYPPRNNNNNNNNNNVLLYSQLYTHQFFQAFFLPNCSLGRGQTKGEITLRETLNSEVSRHDLINHNTN